jgi:hypothetical protein
MIKTISLSIVAISLLLVSIVAIAEPPNVDYYPTPSPHAQPDDLITQTVNIILAQGFSGAIIIILFGFIWKEGKNNRATQKENFDKFVQISAECSAHMASVSARLENIEREIETLKMEMLRKG